MITWHHSRRIWTIVSRSYEIQTNRKYRMRKVVEQGIDDRIGRPDGHRWSGKIPPRTVTGQAWSRVRRPGFIRNQIRSFSVRPGTSIGQLVKLGSSSLLLNFHFPGSYLSSPKSMLFRQVPNEADSSTDQAGRLQARSKAAGAQEGGKTRRKAADAQEGCRRAGRRQARRKATGAQEGSRRTGRRQAHKKAAGAKEGGRRLWRRQNCVFSPSAKENRRIGQTEYCTEFALLNV